MKPAAMIWYIMVFVICTGNAQLVSVEEDGYTVCQKYKGTFTPHSDSDTRGRLVGSPGKSGAKGDLGPPGPKGDPGNIDDSVTIQNLREELNAIKACQGLYRAGICYYLIEELLVFSEAVSACKRDGGNLAVIDGRQLYGALMRFVHDAHAMFQSVSYIQMWMDGTYQDGTVQLSDGRTAPFLLWYPGYPTSYDKHIYMAFEVKKNLAGNQNMFNINSLHSCYPLCQK